MAALAGRALRNNETRRATIDEQTIVLFGDSIIEEGDWGELLADHRTSNHGYSGFTTEELVPIAAEIAERRPGDVYILTGTNDIRDDHPPSWTTDQLGLILDIFAAETPETRIVLQSVLPRADAPDEVDATNTALRTLASERGLHYLDVHRVLDGGDGGLRPTETRDGIHLSDDGYTRWATVLTDDLRAIDRSNR